MRNHGALIAALLSPSIGLFTLAEDSQDGSETEEQFTEGVDNMRNRAAPVIDAEEWEPVQSNESRQVRRQRERNGGELRRVAFKPSYKTWYWKRKRERTGK